MGYYHWVTDHYGLYCEMKSNREWTGKNYKYSYFFEVAVYPKNGPKHVYFTLPFLSKDELSQFFDKFTSKFEPLANRYYDEQIQKWISTPISIQQIVEITDETIKKCEYGKRKSSRLYLRLYENV